MQFCKTKQKQNAEDGNLKSFGKNNETEKLQFELRPPQSSDSFHFNCCSP